MSNMDRIIKFAKRLEVETVHYGCPVKKLFMGDKISYSVMAVVPMSPEVDEEVNQSDVAYKMRVEVTMRRARHDYESAWRWQPVEYDHGMLCFYHHDFEAMLAFAADYLEEHVDPKVDSYSVYAGSKDRKPLIVKCIKHTPIGRLVHVTDDPDYESYNL